MVRPDVVVRDTRVEVAPGEVVEVAASVHNPSTTVEDYELSVVGVPGAWSSVAPPLVALMPDEQRDVTVVLRPGTGWSAPVGELAFGLRCRSTVDPSVSAVAEADVVVTAQHGASVRLLTVSGTGRWRGRYRVDVTNTGSVPAQVQLEVTQPEDELAFALRDATLEVRPGATASAYLVVRPRRPGGPVRRHAFSVAWRLDPPTAEGVVEGAFTQRPVVPRRPVVTGAAIAVLAVAALAGYRAWQPAPDPAPVAAPAPVLISADAVPGGVRAEWQAVPGVEGYQLRRTVGDGGAVEGTRDVDAAQTADVWPDLPAGEHCLTVVAVTGGEASDPSDPLCATVAATEPVPGVVVVHYVAPIADVGAYDRTREQATLLADAGVTVEIARSAEVPALAARGEPSYVLYHGGFADRAQADAYCALLADAVAMCEPVEPLPADEASPAGGGGG